MSALDLIQDFGRNVTVTRTAPGSYVSGNYVIGAQSTFDTIMSVQPLSGKERLDLPEGQRTKNVFKVYSSVQIFTTEQVASEIADILSFDGLNFEVMRVEYWYSANLDIDPYWKAILMEKNP